MNTLPAIALLFTLLMLSAAAVSQPTCVAPTLTDQQVKELIDEARDVRTDLPAPFSDFRSTTRRHGCHYVYIEFGIPETIHYEHIFTLNQHGVIVDVQSGETTVDLQCPDEVLAESELAEIVSSERAIRDDLPPPYPEADVQVTRSRCMYRYFEFAVPGKRGKYQVFNIDPYGELYDFSVSQPY